jgi:hypothetical protein
MNGSGSPSGYHLLRLARECDAVFEAVLDLTGHRKARLAIDLHAAEVSIARAMGALEILKRQDQPLAPHVVQTDIQIVRASELSAARLRWGTRAGASGISRGDFSDFPDCHVSPLPISAV